MIDVAAMIATLGSAESGAGDDVDRIDLLGDLERLKKAAEAAQAALTRDLHASTVATEATQGVRARERGKAVGLQVALARRVSHHRGRTLVGLARAAATDLPHLHAAWRTGEVSERRMCTVLGRVSHLDGPERRLVDAALAATPAALHAFTTTPTSRLEGYVDTHAYPLDKRAYVERRAHAETERHVTTRPAPDCMLRLSALLPLTEGVAVVAALGHAADTAHGDPDDHRTRGQVMADTLVTRTTGHDPLDGPAPVQVTVTVPVETVTQDDDTSGAPAWLAAGAAGASVPADLARGLVAAAAEQEGRWRRAFTDPATGQLVALESTGRRFPTGLATYLRARDRWCRTPWCGAPIRHQDHVTPVEHGGPTTADNGQGLCEACNHAKQAPGWAQKAGPDPDGTHTVETTTPTGHVHTSRPPPTGLAQGPSIDGAAGSTPTPSAPSQEGTRCESGTAPQR